MRLDPGKMNRSITIQQFTAATPAQDDAGEPLGTWTTYATAWAEKYDVGGRERFQASERQAEVGSVFKIYYDSGITHKMRISCDSVVYNIRYINEIGYRDGLEIRTTAERD